MILTQRRFCTKKKILIKFKISMHINDQHFYIEFLYQTRVENTKNSFSPFTKDLLTIKYNVNNKKSAWRVHRLNPSLAPRQISSRRGRFIASGLGENCGPARNRWKLNACEYPLLSWRTMPPSKLLSPLSTNTLAFLLLLGISELYREFHLVSSTFRWFFFFFNFHLREGREEGTREICSIWIQMDLIWGILSFDRWVVSNKYGGGRGTRCFKREIN